MDGGLRIVLVHGTWGRGFDPDTVAPPPVPRWFEPESEFCRTLKGRLAGRLGSAVVVEFLWSGANSIREREEAAAELAAFLDRSIVQAPQALHFILAHSHGGNVAIDALAKMEQSAGRIHIVTLATPFLSISQGTSSLLTRMLRAALVLSLATLIAVLYALVLDRLAELGAGIPALFAVGIISVGIIAFCAVGAARMRRLAGTGFTAKPFAHDGHNAVFLAAVRAVPASALLAAPGFYFLGALAWLACFMLMLPLVTAIAAASPALLRLLFSPPGPAGAVRRRAAAIRILRSPRDEASLFLLFGRVTSILTHIFGALAVMFSPVVILLGSLMAAFAIKGAVEFYDSYQKCLATGDNCYLDIFVPALVFAKTLEVWGGIVSYVTSGAIACLLLFFLTGLLKSAFGRELLFRSMNVSVDVHDTPGGSTRYVVDWCRPLRGAGFGLRHSLYNNPEAIAKIVEFIEQARTSRPDLNIDVAETEPELSAGPRLRGWRHGAIWISAAAVYAFVLLIAYAPHGADSSSCAVKSRLEPPGSRGVFTVLVARFEGDDGRLSNQLARELARRYPVSVLRTCLSVATGDEARSLRSSRGVNLLLWGKAKGGTVELYGEEHYPGTAGERPTLVAPGGLPAFLDGQGRALLIEGVERAHLDDSSPRTSGELASYADQVDRFVRQVEERDLPNGDILDDLTLAQDKVSLHAAAGIWMLSAGVALREGWRIRKSIAHFDRAFSIRNGNPEYREVISVDWNLAYRESLLWDARLNKSLASARQAADQYQKEYEHGLANYQVTPDSRSLAAARAASAWAEVAALGGDAKAGAARNRLACESLLWAHQWESDSQEMREQTRSDARMGVSRGFVRVLPPPEQTEAYNLLVKAGKDPSPIFRINRETHTDYCTAFE